VSEADRASEAAIVELLERERPDDAIVGEEGAQRPGSGAGARRWVIDPLDGTTSYLYRYPAWCVSVALEDSDGALAGVVHDPLRDETFAAARGRGCRLNGEPARVREETDLGHALLATGFGYDSERRALQADTVRLLLPRVRDLRRGGAAALDLAYVAAGRIDAFYERGLNAWDWAAGRLCVDEAGGVTRDLPGEPHGVVATNAALIEPLCELLAGAPF
jgi:myo-inositol-1(or 4)-monophosphatase